MGMDKNKSNSKSNRPWPSSSATLYKENTKKKGNDGNTWIVSLDKKGTHRWKLHQKPNSKSKTLTDNKKKVIKKKLSKSKTNTDNKKKVAKKKVTKSKTKTKTKSKSKPKRKSKMKSNKKLTALDFYDVKHVSNTVLNNIANKSSKDIKSTFKKLNALCEDIRKLNKHSHIVPLPLSQGGIYWSDYAGDYMTSIYADEYWYENFMYFTVYMNVTGKEIDSNSLITGKFTDLSANEKRKIIDLLDKHLKNQYTWSGKNTDVIKISFTKEFDTKINKSSLKDNDVYPALHLSVITSDDLFASGLALEYSKEIKTVVQGRSNKNFDHGYGVNDMNFVFYTIDKSKVNDIIKKLQQYFKPYVKNKKITHYSISYWTDADTMAKEISEGKPRFRIKKKSKSKSKSKSK